MGIDQFNTTLDIWTRELTKYDIHQLLKKPGEKSWSLGQLYVHLLEETKWYLSQIEESLNDQDHAHRETSEAAKALFERGSFEDKKFQGDPLISENIKQPKSVEQLFYDFAQLKNEVHITWIKMQGTKEFGKSQHPGMGYLDCFEWLVYAEMHLRHHLKQLARMEHFLEQNQSRGEIKRANGVCPSRAVAAATSAGDPSGKGELNTKIL